MSVRDWFAAGLQLVTNQLSAMKLDQLKRFRRLLYSWFKFTRTRQVKVSYQATSIQKPVLDCLCPLRDCLLFTKDRLILVSIILAAAKTCGFSAGLVTGRSLISIHLNCPIQSQSPPVISNHLSPRFSNLDPNPTLALYIGPQCSWTVAKV